MWRSKKFIIGTILAVVLLAGSIGGAVLAADDSEVSDAEAAYDTLLERVCAIYEEKTGSTIDQDALKESFADAQEEMRNDAMETWLQNQVDEGRITQEEADQYLEWWQNRPDISVGFGLRGGHRGFAEFGGCRGWGGMGLPE